MFEKEAEEYAKKVYGNSTEMDYYGIADAFKDGAEFGYNKANKWHILAEESDILPKEGQRVKVLTEEGNIENSTYYYDTYYEEFAWSNIGLLKVFAWKEIELPELKESE